MNDLVLLAIMHATAGPLRAEALAAPRTDMPGAAGARLSLELPTGPVRPLVAVSGASWSRTEIDVTLRAGLVTGDRVRVFGGWMGTDLEADDRDGGPRHWAAVEIQTDF
jgi:hypothetical protein